MELECTWMRESNIDWIIQVPSCIVLIVNLTFLIRIMFVSWQRRRHPSSAKIIQFPVRHLPGIDYETAIGKHGRDTPIPQGVQGAASTYTAARHYVFNSYRRAGWGAGKSYLRRFTSIPTQYSRFFRRAFLLLPELGGATGAKASL